MENEGCRYGTCGECDGCAPQQEPTCHCEWTCPCHECCDDRDDRDAFQNGRPSRFDHADFDEEFGRDPAKRARTDEDPPAASDDKHPSVASADAAKPTAASKPAASEPTW